MDTKTCKICHQDLPISDYYINRTVFKEKTYTNTRTECKKCNMEKYYTHHDRVKKYSDENERRLARKKMRNANTRKLKIETINAYGGICDCCGEEKIEFLALDHINGSGNQKRKNGEPSGSNLYSLLRKLNFPQGEFRVLCHNCNQSIGNYGYCPHKVNYAESRLQQ